MAKGTVNTVAARTARLQNMISDLPFSRTANATHGMRPKSAEISGGGVVCLSPAYPYRASGRSGGVPDGRTLTGSERAPPPGVRRCRKQEVRDGGNRHDHPLPVGQYDAGSAMAAGDNQVFPAIRSAVGGTTILRGTDHHPGCCVRLQGLPQGRQDRSKRKAHEQQDGYEAAETHHRTKIPRITALQQPRSRRRCTRKRTVLLPRLERARCLRPKTPGI